MNTLTITDSTSVIPLSRCREITITQVNAPTEKIKVDFFFFHPSGTNYMASS
jgi:hypothetical protein